MQTLTKQTAVCVDPQIHVDGQRQEGSNAGLHSKQCERWDPVIRTVACPWFHLWINYFTLLEVAFDGKATTLFLLSFLFLFLASPSRKKGSSPKPTAYFLSNLIHQAELSEWFMRYTGKPWKSLCVLLIISHLGGQLKELPPGRTNEETSQRVGRGLELYHCIPQCVFSLPMYRLTLSHWLGCLTVEIQRLFLLLFSSSCLLSSKEDSPAAAQSMLMTQPLPYSLAPYPCQQWLLDNSRAAPTMDGQ